MAQDVFKVMWWGYLSGQRCEVDWYFQSTSTASPDPLADAQRLIQGVNAVALTSLQQCLPRNWRGTWFVARRVNNGGGPNAQRRILLNGSPGSGYASRPTVCPYISMAYYRGGRWRSHHFTVPALWDGGPYRDYISPAQQTELIALMFDLSQIIFTPGPSFRQVIWDRSSATSATIESYILTNRARMVQQRRRPNPA